MKERPIPFSGEMVRAILEGRKTQTRRVIKPQPVEKQYPHRWTVQVSPTTVVACGDPETALNYVACPHGVPGDRLWVRERQRVTEVDCIDARIRVHYEADGVESGWIDYPSRLKGEPVVGKCLSYGGFRESSRLLLEVKSVRVERLQDISEEDAAKEGINDDLAMMTDGLPGPYVLAFECLWDSLNEKRGYGWDVNPWVWVVGFQRVEASQ